MTKLHLFFPQWQGSGGDNEIYSGAKILQKHLPHIPFKEIPVPENEVLQMENGICGFRSVLAQLKHAQDFINHCAPDVICTVGGDCGTEVPIVSYLNQKYNGDLAVIWLDAHGDLNTPESSPSHNFHGMPLRTLLGEGDPQILKICSRLLEPKQIFLVGVRDLDPPEKIFIRKNRVKTFPSLENSDALIEAIQKQKLKHVYLHFDLDILDPAEFPSVKYPAKQGPPIELVYAMLTKLKTAFSTAGASLLEFVPTPNPRLDVIDKLASLLFE